MVMYPGVSVEVYKDYNVVATYETDAYHLAGYGVLPNGNVYFCEYRLVDTDSASYDFLLSGYKIDVVHTVLDVTTGEAKEVANNFIATKIFTNATENINTFINLQTRVLESSMFGYTLLEGIEMKDGYILAETQAFANGALQDNTVFAV